MAQNSTGRRVTIYDVAEAAGVSKSLVSLVLQGSPRVSPERRAAVEHAMADLGYRPSRAATALAGRRSRTVGVVIDDFRNLWFVDLLDGIREVLGRERLAVTVADLASDPGDGSELIGGLVASSVDALVLACEPTAALAGPHDVPVVVAGNRRRAVTGASIVTSDDRGGTRLALDHLIGLGHRRIAHLTGDDGSSGVRRDAYVAVMAERGLPALVERGSGRTNEPDGYESAARALRDDPGLTAILAANDSMALGALAAIQEAGLSMPGDVSLMGYDDSPVAESRILRLTTVDPDSREVGRRVAQTLLARLSGEPAGETVRLTPRLVVRSSTATARA